MQEENMTYDYADFGKRLVAFIIDGLILGVSVGIIMSVFSGVFFSSGGVEMLENMENDPTAILTILMGYAGIMVVSLIIGWLYFALQESSEKMATVGKRAMGIVVTDLDGNRISFARATGRFFGKYLSGMIMYIGYIMAAFTEKKQALHDMIAGSLVMKDH